MPPKYVQYSKQSWNGNFKTRKKRLVYFLEILKKAINNIISKNVPSGTNV